jgi:solute:Na+ symporter, SSS family
MSSFHLTFPDYVVIGGYFLVVLWVGFYFKKHQAAASDYFAAGHQIPWWLAGISHYMSSFSAFSFIAYSQTAYSYGWVAVTLFWVTMPACILGGMVFARRWRRARVITPVEFLEKRFNSALRQLFAWAGIPVKIFDDALKIFATGLFLALGIGMEVKSAILICGVVMVAYTFMGGLWALVVTDYVQFLMKMMAIGLLFPMALWKAGGISHAFKGLPPGFLHLSGGPYGWTYILGFTLLMIISYNGSWALAQKYYSVPDERSASKAAYLAAGLNFFGAPLMLLPAILGRHFLPDLAAQHRTADTYVLLVLELLPVGMIGVIVAAMFSATMATVSADLNAIASVLTKDVYHRMVNPAASESGLLRVGRTITAALGALVVILSLWIALSHSESLFHVMVTAFGLLLAPTLLPLLAGLTVRWLTWKGAFAGFLAGLLAGVLTLALKTWYLPNLPGISPEWANYTFEGISILINVAATCFAMYAGSRWLRTSKEETARIDAFFAALDQPVAAAEAGSFRPVAYLRAIGGPTVVVGALLILAALFVPTPSAQSTDLILGAAFAGLGVWLVTRK